MKTTFLKKTYSEGPETYYAINSDKIQEMELWGTYGQFGQVVGHEDAGDYHPENIYSDAKIHLEFALTERFGKEFELSGIGIETINGKDPEGDLTEYKNFIDEWIKENQTLTKCKGFTYWNGHNWQSVIVESELSDTEYEIIDDENLISELTKALEEKKFVQESFGKKLYEGNGYNIEVSQFASAWWEYELTQTTFDIRFDDDENSNSIGIAESLSYCKDYIKQHNGTNHSYFSDYKGGTVSIVSNETGEKVFETEVR